MNQEGSPRQTHAPFFFVAGANLIPGAAIELGTEDAHHLSVVRRAKPGDVVRVSNGSGAVATAKLTEVSREGVGAKVNEVEQISAPSPAVTVFQGLAKGEKVDLAVQMLVELGVDEIFIFSSGRSVPDWDERKSQQVQARWSGKALEAAKQSHRAFLPRVSGPHTMKDASMRLKGFGLVLAGHGGARTRLRDAVRSSDAGSIAVVIGPEGGLDEKELALLREAGAVPVTLGDQVLRTETAGLVMASLVMYETGRLG